MFEDPKLIYWTATKQQLGVAQKGEVGDKVLHWNLKGQPHVLLNFCELKKTYQPRWYTHRYGGGSWASSQGWLCPFLGKYGRYTDRYRRESWASLQGRLWPIVGLPRAPTKLYVHSRSTKFGVYGGKNMTREHPHSQCFYWKYTADSGAD